jgi:hypothetical protein
MRQKKPEQQLVGSTARLAEKRPATKPIVESELTDRELNDIAGGRIRGPSVTVPSVVGPYTSTK